MSFRPPDRVQKVNMRTTQTERACPPSSLNVFLDTGLKIVMTSSSSSSAPSRFTKHSTRLISSSARGSCSNFRHNCDCHHILTRLFDRIVPTTSQTYKFADVMNVLKAATVRPSISATPHANFLETDIRDLIPGQGTYCSMQRQEWPVLERGMF